MIWHNCKNNKLTKVHIKLERLSSFPSHSKERDAVSLVDCSGQRHQQYIPKDRWVLLKEVCVDSNIGDIIVVVICRKNDTN
jgi:hypothetical protein